MFQQIASSNFDLGFNNCCHYYSQPQQQQQRFNERANWLVAYHDSAAPTCSSKNILGGGDNYGVVGSIGISRRNSATSLNDLIIGNNNNNSPSSSSTQSLSVVPNVCLLLVDLLREIFVRICPSPRELLTLALVCKKFRNLVEDPATWRYMTERDFDVHLCLNKGFNWKLYYREKLAFTQPLNWEEIQSEIQPSPRQSHGAGNVGNQMYIFGGHQVVDETFSRKDDVWTFNPSTNNFQQVSLDGPSLPALSRHRMVTVNNKLYSIGGILQDKTKINTIYCFDFSLGRWEVIEPAPGSITPAPRCDPVVVTYGTDIVVFGGSVQNMDFPSDIYVFNTLTKQWTQPQASGEVPPSRIGCTGVVIDDTMYIYGGGDYNKDERKYESLFTETWALDLKAYKWSKLEATGDVVPTICDFLSSFVIGHHFVVVGGWCTEELYAFDTVAKRWTMLVNKDPTKINNNDATATVIGNSVYLFGGYQNAYQHHMCKLDISHLSFLQPQDTQSVTHHTV